MSAEGQGHDTGRNLEGGGLRGGWSSVPLKDKTKTPIVTCATPVRTKLGNVWLFVKSALRLWEVPDCRHVGSATVHQNRTGQREGASEAVLGLHL